jgi:hypothetical protein
VALGVGAVERRVDRSANGVVDDKPIARGSTNGSSDSASIAGSVSSSPSIAWRSERVTRRTTEAASSAVRVGRSTSAR